MRIPSARLAALDLAAMLALSVGCTKATFSLIPSTGGSGGGGAEGLDTASPDLPTDLATTCDPMPVLGCKPQPAEPCDPVCQTQTGTKCSWCTQKCSIDNSGAPTCASLDPSPKLPGAACNINTGPVYQSDDCDRGAICLNSGGAGEVSANCFTLCRNSTNCRGVATGCTPRPLGIGTTTLVCDPPPDTCDPTVPTACCNPITDDTSCKGSPGTCYLLSKDSQTGNSRTVCEFASGGTNAKIACTYSRECLAKLTCAPSPGGGLCQRVCDDTHPCPAGALCNKATTGGQYGYCPP
jgi:hypothetical protein